MNYTCIRCQGAAYQHTEGTYSVYCALTECGRQHLLTDEHLSGLYSWAVEFANGTVYMPMATDPATAAPELAEGLETRRVWLTDLRGEMTGAQLAELSLSAHRDTDDEEDAAADTECGASLKTRTLRRWCNRALGHAGKHTSEFGDTWTG